MMRLDCNVQDAGNGLGEGGLVPLVTVSRLALCSLLAHVFRVGQNVICTVYICIYRVLANTAHVVCQFGCGARKGGIAVSDRDAQLGLNKQALSSNN